MSPKHLLWPAKAQQIQTGGREGEGEADGLKLFGMSIGSCKGAPTIYLFTMFEGGACQLKI